MSSKRWALVGLGVAVAVALVALLLAARNSGSSTPRTADRAPAEPAATETRPADTEAEVRARPQVEAPPENDDTDAGPRVYVRDDGKVVRDHRPGNPDPMLTGGVPVPEKLRRVQKEVIYSVRKAVRPLVYPCAEELDADSFGDDPMLQAEVMVSIESETLTVDQVDVKFRDVDAETESVADCVRAAISEVTFAAEGHEDVSRYWLTMPFKLRR